MTIRDIAIIGGGIAGLTAAIALKQKGYDVTVYEKAHQFEPMGGDLPLWPNALQLFDQLGLYHSLYNISGRYEAINIGTEDDQLLDKLPSSFYHQIAPYDPLNICRYELQNLLIAALDHETILLNKQCVQIKQNENKVIVSFQDGTEISSDLLIGADGAQSIVRNYVYPDWQRNYSGYISMGGITTEEHYLKYNLILGKYFSGAFPVSNLRNMFFFVMPHTDCDIYQIYPTLQSQINLFKHHSPILDEMLSKLEKSINLTKNYFFVKNYTLLPLPTWYKERVVLLGDAAHQVGAILGCATSVILEGVRELINSLSNNSDYAMALQQYQNIHQIRAMQLYWTERKYANILIHQQPFNFNEFNNSIVNLLKPYKLPVPV